MFISPPTHACSLDPLRRRVGCFEIPDFVVLHAVVQPYGTSAIPGHSGHAPLQARFRHFHPPFRSCPFRCRTIYFGQAGRPRGRVRRLRARVGQRGKLGGADRGSQSGNCNLRARVHRQILQFSYIFRTLPKGNERNFTILIKQKHFGHKRLRNPARQAFQYTMRNSRSIATGIRKDKMLIVRLADRIFSDEARHHLITRRAIMW